MKGDLVFGRSLVVLLAPILLSVLAYNFVRKNKKSVHPKADGIEDSNPSVTSTGSDSYHMFLSFSGKGTHKTFGDHLYKGLVSAGICVFRDNDGLCEGEKIDTNLLEANTNSKISIPILSRNYASSKWCLLELLQMTECMKSIGHVVLPIFYRVEPSEVRHQKGSFGKTFSHFSGEHPEEDVAKWIKALQEVACLKRWESERNAY